MCAVNNTSLLGSSPLVRVRSQDGSSLHHQKTADARFNHIMHVIYRSLHLWNWIRLPCQTIEDVTVLVSGLQQLNIYPRASSWLGYFQPKFPMDTEWTEWTRLRCLIRSIPGSNRRCIWRQWAKCQLGFHDLGSCVVGQYFQLGLRRYL